MKRKEQMKRKVNEKEKGNSKVDDTPAAAFHGFHGFSRLFILPMAILVFGVQRDPDLKLEFFFDRPLNF
jgi:hypothetical protein